MSIKHFVVDPLMYGGFLLIVLYVIGKAYVIYTLKVKEEKIKEIESVDEYEHHYKYISSIGFICIFSSAIIWFFI